MLLIMLCVFLSLCVQGWGENFHFGGTHPRPLSLCVCRLSVSHRCCCPPPPNCAVRSKGESFAQSLITHEHVLASRLQLDPGARVLDLGCGVGGPMRNIAKFSGLRVTGINNNDYQLKRLTAMNKARGLDKQCEGLKGNFMCVIPVPVVCVCGCQAASHLTSRCVCVVCVVCRDLEKTIPRGTYDGAYAIEATCHAPDRTKCFSEVFASIKPGGRFVCYEWVMTDKYNPRNAYHKQLKDGIELGNALPDITDAEAVRKSLQDAGFNVVEVTDVAPTSEVTWYEPFEPKWTLQGFKTTPVGIKLTNMVVKAMELVKLAPKGSAEMHNNLSVGAITLYEAGRLGIFTPMLLCVAEKPL